VKRNGKLLEFLLFVIDDGSQAHAAIKFICDVKYGISSKCVKPSTINKVLSNTRDGPDQVLTNILYGLNPKFEGMNVNGADSEFARGFLKQCPVLIVGMDVNHGQAKPRDKKAQLPSTVGIVGTRDLDGTLYNAFMRAQRKPSNNADREVIQAQVLKPAMAKILKGYAKETGKKPERIIVYRDGVSTGQFQAVLHKEMRAIVETGQEVFGANYRPPITFITVQKRHSTRLFPSQVTADWKGNEKQNPVAGTVVDQIMTTSKVFNFFMASHEGIQGTSKPAHYTVLKDENKFTSDQIQSLTYYMCHLYGKCPRAVSLPSPIYYAHLVAFRAAEIGAYKFFQSPLARSLDARTYSSGSTGDGDRQLEEDERAILDAYNAASEVDENFSRRMYFL